MKEIQLSRGYVTIVDDCDFNELSQYKWWYLNSGYATRRIGGRKNPKQLLMHRVILNAQPGMEVDHIDGNGLNNCRSNIRICTHAENLKNMKKCKRNTSGYKGVTWIKSRNQWMAQLFSDGHNHNLGYFDEIENAVAAYKIAESTFFGKFAREDRYK